MSSRAPREDGIAPWRAPTSRLHRPGAAALFALPLGPALVALLVAGAPHVDPAGAAPSAAAGAGDIERGRYIANDVAMCVLCHSPRDDAGVVDETRLFQGAPVPVASPFRGQLWATQAPAIAGTSGLSIEDEMSVLTTGRRLDGRKPMPPMPPFRLTQEDAAAVIAYLRSLPSGSRSAASAAAVPRAAAQVGDANSTLDR